MASSSNSIHDLCFSYGTGGSEQEVLLREIRRDARIIQQIDLKALNHGEFKQANNSIRVIHASSHDVIDRLVGTLNNWQEYEGRYVWDKLMARESEVGTSEEVVHDRLLADANGFSLMNLLHLLSFNLHGHHVMFAQDSEGTIQAVGTFKEKGQRVLITELCTAPSNLVLHSIRAENRVSGCASAIIKNILFWAIGSKSSIEAKVEQDSLSFFENLGFKQTRTKGSVHYLALSVDSIRQRLSRFPTEVNSESPALQQIVPENLALDDDLDIMDPFE